MYIRLFGRRCHLRHTAAIKLGCIFLVVLFIVASMIAKQSPPLSPEELRYVAQANVGANGKQKPFLQRGTLGNFEPPPEPLVSGIGEGGKAVKVDKNDADYKRYSREYGINMGLSDEIRMVRVIPDTRPDECKYWQYPKNLPTASVIIVFHNEGLSVLMRTVHTVIARSPPEYLHEVLLVDDYSAKEPLKGGLEKEIQKLPKVRLIRNSAREGLIRTRSIGAENARGDVVIFLDAHCEVNKNWLVPLLAVIYENRKTMAVPVIDGIDMNTFEYHPVYRGNTQLAGTFEWGLLYKETAISKEEKRRRKHPSEPYRSPTHAGGLFAIDRKFFLDMGGYDPGLDIWGGENFELSFKIWMCGGMIEWVPCSRVGHVYRAFMPYGFGGKKGNVVSVNYKRVVEVWMDEYKKYFYIRKPEALSLDPGNLTAQKQWRERNNCKSFKWFMDNVAYQVLTEFPLLPDNLAWGAFRNELTNLCLDVASGSPGSTVGVHNCHGLGGNQLLRLNTAGRMGTGERCIDVGHNKALTITVCTLGAVDGPWKYIDKSKQLQHQPSGQCLSVRGTDTRMTDCDEADSSTAWKLAHLHEKMDL